MTQTSTSVLNLMSLAQNRINQQHTTLTTMSLFEPEKTPDMPSSPVATKQSDLNAFPVTPSPTKDSGSKHQFIDNEPTSNAFKHHARHLQQK